MAKKILIQSVVQKKSSLVNERIISIGGIENNVPWQLSQLAAVSAIEHKRYLFYIKLFESSIDVTVALHNGHKYLATSNDIDDLALLLALPDKNPKIKS